MPPWIAAVGVLLAALLALLAWLGRAVQAGLLQDLYALRAEIERLRTQRTSIHGPAYPHCPQQQRLLFSPLTRECSQCAANTRRRRALLRKLPLPLRIINRALAPFVLLTMFLKRQARARRATAGPARPGMLRGVSTAGILKQRRHRRAAEQHRPAAEAGDVNAQYRLGFELYHGGDHTGAETWYRKAVEQGHVPAMVNLGFLLDCAGRKQEALTLFEAAAEWGDPSGAHNASITADDLGDAMKAHALRLRAAELGHPRAKAALESRGR